jgi:hypothetical protein
VFPDGRVWPCLFGGINLTRMEKEDDEIPVQRSAVADEITDLRRKIQKIAEERERLPQPLFWSLFHTRLAAIKKHKEIDRALSALLGEGDH